MFVEEDKILMVEFFYIVIKEKSISNNPLENKVTSKM